MAPRPPGQPVFALRIQLADVEPPVWRRLLVPGSLRLDKLHAVIQAAMGWTNSHLHAFVIEARRYGMHLDDYPDDEIDEHDVTVMQAIGKTDHFEYEYDFGDSWDHEIVVERFSRHPLGLKFAVCLEGENACPPEDVGGSGGYSEFRVAIADRAHPEHEAFLEWIGGSFDPSAFDLASTNAALQRVR
jgi:hypothetical protein